ncbi:ABC transporter substrate-binding protein [Pseudomonas sp. C27(2019)]|uniref:ABC transporter substrate-binding protein n=1 Tax=Pseudomonas sp. C27(2019) TaxID=2604941 RepID=UPI001243B339|nr:ABC transporter substrate-binding protein [Pseudomonas sp. C27(2019)]QEY59084.1 ABC transporter substrate-binding protein [Pseudomonas sp. C27(2019)]
MMSKLASLFLLAVLSVALTACGEAEVSHTSTLRVASWSQPITEQINLLVDDKDFFSKHNIAIEFIPGAGGGDAIKNIASGKADIAFTDPGSLFAALDKGEKLIALYDIYPHNVFNVVALKDSNISRPEDLKGKKIGVYSLSSGTRQNLLVLLKQAGLSEADVEIIATGVLNFGPLMQGLVDATAATDTGLATGKGKGLAAVDVMQVKDYFNYSSDVFVVTEATYAQKKDQLLAFLAGYKDSVQWMLANPEEAAQRAVKHAIDGKDQAHNLNIIELRNASSLPLSGDVSELGLLDLDNLQRAADMYYELGLISQKLDLSQAVNQNHVLAK